MLFYPTNKRVAMKVRKAFTAGAQVALSQFFYEIRQRFNIGHSTILQLKLFYKTIFSVIANLSFM